MICQICKKNKATVTIIQTTGTSQAKLNLCEECANYLLGNSISDYSFTQNNLSEILNALLQSFHQYNKEVNPVKKDLTCKHCGMSYDEFLKKGKLGCDECYEVFHKQLIPLLNRLHGHYQHTGKVPKKVQIKTDHLNRLKELREKLQQAILKEEYENAAIIRDEITEEEKRIG